MSDMTPIARPYARAVFQLALASKTLPVWSQMLENTARIAEDTRVLTMLQDPTLSAVQRSQFFIDICRACLNEEGLRLLRVLAESRRLRVLPAIYALFKRYKDEHDQVSEVKVISANELTAAYKKKLTAALHKRLKREVVLSCTIDKTLMGGAVLRIRDDVIDGSIRGKLSRLRDTLTR